MPGPSKPITSSLPAESIAGEQINERIRQCLDAIKKLLFPGKLRIHHPCGNLILREAKLLAVVEHQNALHTQSLGNKMARVKEAGHLVGAAVVIRHLPGDHNSGVRTQQRDNHVDQRVADVIKQHVITVRRSGLQLRLHLCDIARVIAAAGTHRLVINRVIEAGFVLEPFAFDWPTRYADNICCSKLASNLARGRANRACGR